MITLALSKGRIFEETLPLLKAAGIEVLEDPETSRKLILSTSNPQVRVIDIRDPKSYAANHIPGAVNAPYGTWRGPANNPGELPELPKLTALVQSLGLTPATHAVVVSSGADATDFGASARVYWTLKVLGLGATHGSEIVHIQHSYGSYMGRILHPLGRQVQPSREAGGVELHRVVDGLLDPARIAVRWVEVFAPGSGGVDFTQVARVLLDFCRSHIVMQVCYDRYQLRLMMQQLGQAGVWCVEFGQSTARLEADKMLRDLISTRMLAHDGDATLTAHVLNANAKVEGDDRIRIVKREHAKKIDAAVALSMACNRLLTEFAL